MIMSEIIVRSLDLYPDEWELDAHFLTHARSGVRVWVCNGPDHLRVDLNGAEQVLGCRERLRIWRAYRRWARKRLYDAVLGDPLARIATPEVPVDEKAS